VGPRVGTDWVITSGLKTGEKVVVEGLQKIRAGTPVTAKAWSPPAEKPNEQTAEAKSGEGSESKPETH
jgi:membrane fusion protein, multidrug efflux system